MLISKTYSVDYAHRLKDHPGKCRNLHGHTGVFTITFSGDVKYEDGMVVDFGKFDWLKEIIDRLDHCLIIQITDPLYLHLRNKESSLPSIFGDMKFFTCDDPPTAEIIIDYIKNEIFMKLDQEFQLKDLELVRVDFAETPGNVVSWVEEG